MTTSIARMTTSIVFQDDDFETMSILLVPGAEETAEDDEFPEMVGVMVGDEEGFARRRRWVVRGIAASSPVASAWGGSRRWVALRS